MGPAMAGRGRLLGVILILAAVACGGCGGGASGEINGTVRSNDGVPIDYRCEGTGDPALVFVHGWSCDGGYWRAQVERFSRTHKVVTLDLAGHGGSGSVRRAWTMEAFGADVKAVVDELDLRDIILIGHSMGGAVIVEAALSMPGRVRGLIGVDNFQSLSLGLTEEQIDGFVGSFRPDFEGMTRAWVTGMFPEGADPALVEEIAGDMAGAPPEVALGALRELLVWYSEKTEQRLGALAVPLRCINSDKIPTDGEGISKIVPRFEVRVVPGSGHFFFREHPEEFNRLLEGFLALFEEEA